MRAISSEKPMFQKDYKYGDVIRRRRLQLGLTQRQVADQCGITDSAFAHIEREMRLPSESVAGRIVKALGLTPKVQAQFEAGLKRVRDLQSQNRVRNRNSLKPLKPIRGEDARNAPDTSDLARDLADDPDLLKGYLYLKTALGKRGQRKTVLLALEAWANDK